MISRPPRMAIKKSMTRNFLLLNYHAFVAIHPLIAVTFSTPTPDCINRAVRQSAATPYAESFTLTAGCGQGTMTRYSLVLASSARRRFLLGGEVFDADLRLEMFNVHKESSIEDTAKQQIGSTKIMSQ